MIGKNLAQEEYNWPSKFQGMDFKIIKILSVPFNKVCPPGPFLVPASLETNQDNSTITIYSSYNIYIYIYIYIYYIYQLCFLHKIFENYKLYKYYNKNL